MNDKNKADSALNAINSGDFNRADWAKIAWSYKANHGDYSIFLQWSKQGANYSNESDCLSVWNEYKEGKGITKGYLFKAATDKGWKPTNKAKYNPVVEFESLPAFTHHDYIDEQQLKGKLNGCASSLKLGDDKKQGEYIALPVASLETGNLTGFIKIFGKGKNSKKYAFGTKKKGNAVLIHQGGDRFLIGEGWADMVNAHHHIDQTSTTLAAGDANNFPALVKSIRAINKSASITILADNDKAGLSMAIKAKPDSIIKPHENFKDYTDAVNAGYIETSEHEIPQETIPDDKGFFMQKDGLHYLTPKLKNGAWVTDDYRVTYTPFEIAAYTRNEDSEDWGKLLRWKDQSGKAQEYLLFNEALAADGREYREMLLSLGLMINPKYKALMSEYLADDAHTPQKFLISATKTGWVIDSEGTNSAYVFPDKTIGGADVVMQRQKVLKAEYAQKGMLSDWRDNVANLCVDNSRLMLSASLGFASMLLPFTNEENGGLQITGGSSTGKTTSMFIAGSIFGDPNKFIKQWRNTSNALEAVARSRNDGILLLDELAQIDPKDAGETVYMLANGAGKGRMSRNAELKEPHTWRVLFLSTGEITLAEHMKSAGKKTRAGQETRIIDIPADTGKHGAFECVYGTKNGADFSDSIKRNCLKFHGTPSRAFAEFIANYDQIELSLDIDKNIKVILSVLVPDSTKADGQVLRVARRFALIGLGGIFAIKANIVNWALDDVMQAIKTCFDAWINQRGGMGSNEETAILAQVQYFFERYGNSRFITDNPEDKTPHDMAGFRQDDDYFVLPQVFNNQICEGYNSKTVIEVCLKNGLLIPAPSGKNVTLKRIHGLGVKRVYNFNISEESSKV